MFQFLIWCVVATVIIIIFLNQLFTNAENSYIYL